MNDVNGTGRCGGAQEQARCAIEAGAAAQDAPQVVLGATLPAAARRAAADTATALVVGVAERGAGHLVLTGGSGGEALARALPAALAGAGLEAGEGLERVHLWFGDERFVPAGHGDRNDLLARDLVEAGVPEANVHRVPGPEAADDVDAAARALVAEIAAHGPGDGRFDVVHLGLGPDAHVCSLFPSHPAALVAGTPATAVRHSPKPPAERVSLTFEVLQRARVVMVVAGGSGKSEAVRAGLGDPDVLVAPASCARAERTTWYLDTDAAVLLPSTT